MIDPHVSKLVRPELEPNEFILWAERIDPEKKKAWMKSSKRADMIWLPIGIAMTILGIIIIFQRFSEDITSGIPLGFGVLVFVASCIIRGKNIISPSRYEEERYEGSYALTNERLFVFDTEENWRLWYLAHKVMKAKVQKKFKGLNRQPAVLVITPVGKWSTKEAELYFLRNFKQSAADINAAIKAHREQH